MTGPLSKADALLAARIAPWVELSAPKAPAGGEEAQPVARSPRVDNEVLLPARPGMYPQVQAQPRAVLPGAGSHAGSGSTALSAAARAILAIESDMHAGQAGPVRASGALWPVAGQPPAAGALASALSQQVSESGLFYESHLVEFASGARSLAQMQREPQAALALAAAAKDRAEETPLQQQRQSAGGLPPASAQAPAASLPAAAASAMAALMPAMPIQPGTQPPVETQTQSQSAAASEPAMEQAEPAAGRQADVPAGLKEYALPRFGHLAQAAVPEMSEPADPLVRVPPADAPASAAVIHPQAATLVHQQLDLLASAMFRWSGEAWPGVPMEWTVQEEGGRQHADESADAQPCWSTRVSLDLPRLGTVNVDLKLNGSSVHAQLVASQAQAADLLRTRGAALGLRMSGAGLRLQSLQLDGEVLAS